MKAAICTLYEGDYHYGVGVLTNSLYNHGFRGIVWVGYRGDLPPWATDLKEGEGYHEYTVNLDCAIRFIKLEISKHLTNHKPHFMWDIWEKYQPDLDALFYFDPDIVNKCRWDFYENWVVRGVSVCGDSWYQVPANHPRKLAWKEFAQSQNMVIEREFDFHYNGGFVGIPKEYKSFLLTWQKLIDIAADEDYLDLKQPYSHQHTNTYPYFPNDQSALNLALMLTPHPITTFGPEGMDFVPGGILMSHATVPTVKPWRKKLIVNALNGDGPSMTDRLYWQHSQAPIKLYSSIKFKWNQFALKAGAGIGRIIRRAAI
ncbi:MAG: hypothetical protein AAF208_12160 [Cyanobacteria bacterium P01_A01_bin.45]